MAWRLALKWVAQLWIYCLAFFTLPKKTDFKNNLLSHKKKKKKKFSGRKINHAIKLTEKLSRAVFQMFL